MALGGEEGKGLAIGETGDLIVETAMAPWRQWEAKRQVSAVLIILRRLIIQVLVA